jgi:esterase/lipase superfamily enzyme
VPGLGSAMRREQGELWSAALGYAPTVVTHGHWGRPVLVFPTEGGRAIDFENNGMLDAVSDLVDAGRVKFYCVDSADEHTWSRNDLPTEQRARNHGAYEAFVLEDVVPFIHRDCGGSSEIITLGASLGAYHAVHIALRRADLFPLAIGLSGNYDPSSWHGWGELGDASYFSNPVAYVQNLHGDHLEWLRHQLSIVLVVGQGAWETHPTGALPSTKQLADALASKGIRCELDLWGTDVSHDWIWWQRQLARHLPRFC